MYQFSVSFYFFYVRIRNCILGCPVVQEWCRYTPAIHAEQLILGFMCIAIGYAFTATMSTSTMTQVLPPGQQVSH
jgi:ceroid-lipofuscinosis MFS transporter 7